MMLTLKIITMKNPHKDRKCVLLYWEKNIEIQKIYCVYYYYVYLQLCKYVDKFKLKNVLNMYPF